jgi:hypothetical protein
MELKCRQHSTVYHSTSQLVLHTVPTMLEALTMWARFAIGSSSSDTAELPAREGRERESEGKREGRKVVREERGMEREREGRVKRE